MNLNRPVKRIAITLSVIAVGFVVAGQTAYGQEKKKPPKITYDEHVKPILQQKCFSCHNPDKAKGDLDMTNYTGLMRGGGSGAVIEPGDSSGSYLYALVSHTEEPYMPPESPKLPDAMIETLRKWIDGGVLENAGSKAMVSNKPKFDLALTEAPTERPAVIPMPARLSLEPVTRTTTTTAVSALATSPWAPLAAVAGQKQVLLYNTKTLEMVGTLPFPEGVPHVLKFSRNGSLLLAGGGRGGAKGSCVVWSVKTGERIFEIGDELDAVLAADISSDQTLIALGGPQRVVRIYSTESGRLLHELRKHTDWIYSVEFSPDSVLLATGDRNGGLMVWEGWTGREYLTLKAHSKGVTGISWRSDSNVVASCSEDGSIRLWEMNNGGQIKNWGGHGGGAASIEFTRDGRLFSCGRDRVAKLWKQDGGQIRAFEAFGDLALKVTFCDETNRAIAGDWKGEIRVWNAVDGARVGLLASNPPKLTERLDAATKQHAVVQTQYNAAATAYNIAQAAAAKAKADLIAAQAAVTAAETKSATAAAAVTAVKQTVAQVTAAHLAATNIVATLAPAVPALNEAATKALDAAAKLKSDKEITEVAAKLKAVATSRAATLAATQKVVAEKAAELAKAKQQLTAAEKLAADALAALNLAKQNVAKLTPLVKPAEEKAAAAKTAAETSAAAVAAAQKQVDRWKAEIVFTTTFNTLSKQLDDATKRLAEQQAKHAELLAATQQAQLAVGKAKTDLAGAQSAASAAEKQVTATAAAVTAVKKVQTDAVAAQVVVAQAEGKLKAALLPLTQAAANTKDAAEKSGGDKELVAAAAQVKTLLDSRTAQLVVTQKSLAEKTKAVETANAQVAAAEKQAADAVTALTAARQKVTAMAAAIKPLEEKFAATKTTSDAGVQVVAAAQLEVDKLKDQIAVHQGLKPATNNTQASAAK